jgi:hypothetical protein
MTSPERGKLLRLDLILLVGGQSFSCWLEE